MIEWLMASMDSSRGHELDVAVAWHGRLMVLAWAVLLPAGVIAARYFKIAPRQNWPGELDSKAWWYAHQGLQYAAGVILVVALVLIWRPLGYDASWHARLGWVVITTCALQFLSAWLRGTKGGPSDPRPDGTLDGDHYDMTTRRKLFEYFHKTAGYIALVLSIAAIGSGLWLVNAPRWMPLIVGVWWLMLIVLWSILQRRGQAIDTYQAIWGPDPKHPGNAVPPIGWGVRRLKPEPNRRPD